MIYCTVWLGQLSHLSSVGQQLPSNSIKQNNEIYRNFQPKSEVSHQSVSQWSSIFIHAFVHKLFKVSCIKQKMALIVIILCHILHLATLWMQPTKWSKNEPQRHTWLAPAESDSSLTSDITSRQALSTRTEDSDSFSWQHNRRELKTYWFRGDRGAMWQTFLCLIALYKYSYWTELNTHDLIST